MVTVATTSASAWGVTSAAVWPAGAVRTSASYEPSQSS